ncbi:hypothetical protein HELRODRAFT_176523 [Helobdella robusta]|uniref:Uncharacterized protein n=1 Tax=Helobdella robusta TaxID=6412 RepID=T1FAM0_HELRO|nr:hypothetical protein HELRODRAFT_176523 [Helobdella robusta]ESN99761.1 hypothetical protein HELRODRAFT_176523 [Helobdella robusta]
MTTLGLHDSIKDRQSNRVICGCYVLIITILVFFVIDRAEISLAFELSGTTTQFFSMKGGDFKARQIVCSARDIQLISACGPVSRESFNQLLNDLTLSGKKYGLKSKVPDSSAAGAEYDCKEIHTLTLLPHAIYNNSSCNDSSCNNSSYNNSSCNNNSSYNDSSCNDSSCNNSSYNNCSYNNSSCNSNNNTINNNNNNCNYNRNNNSSLI